MSSASTTAHNMALSLEDYLRGVNFAANTAVVTAVQLMHRNRFSMRYSVFVYRD